jgi:inorganic pyrophosphatase
MHVFPRHRSRYREMFARRFRWAVWERLFETRGWTIERPAYTPHPDHPEIVYPVDYGFLNETQASDGEPVDCFVGTGSSGLAGAILTTDHRRSDREVKLLYDCTPVEVYTAHGFINYDRTLLTGLLVMRRPMRTLWEGWEAADVT